MPNETTVPILPCRDIDDVAGFYRMLGFEQTFRQTRPNPYIVLRRGGIELHFAAIPDFDPQQSYGSCIIAVDDTAALFGEFAAGMRAVHGKLLLTGIPRITRPRKRKNTGTASGFTVVDPGGNWIRIFRRNTEEPETEAAAETAGGPLARTLQNAVVLGESKGDHRQAAKILDSGLARHSDAPAATLVDALVYRVELALRIDAPDHAETLLTRVRSVVLDDTQREQLNDTLARAAELERDVHVLRGRHRDP